MRTTTDNTDDLDQAAPTDQHSFSTRRRVAALLLACGTIAGLAACQPSPSNMHAEQVAVSKLHYPRTGQNIAPDKVSCVGDVVEYMARDKWIGTCTAGGSHYHVEALYERNTDHQAVSASLDITGASKNIGLYQYSCRTAAPTWTCTFLRLYP